LHFLTDKYFGQYKEEVGTRLTDFHIKSKRSVDFRYLLESSAVFSSNIEGNPIDLNSFMNVKSVKGGVRRKELMEIYELIDAYTFARVNDLTEMNLLRAHGTLSQQFLIESKQGAYRDEREGVYDSGGLVYVAVEPEYVGREMKALFEDITSSLSSKTFNIEESFYFAAMIHLRFAQIHPFVDGNGRVARLLEKWFLASKLGQAAWWIASEQFYWENRPDYYQNINLGVNYYELDYNKCMPFLLMLPKATIIN
jgi:Fic family protein